MEALLSARQLGRDVIAATVENNNYHVIVNLQRE